MGHGQCIAGPDPAPGRLNGYDPALQPLIASRCATAAGTSQSGGRTALRAAQGRQAWACAEAGRRERGHSRLAAPATAAGGWRGMLHWLLELSPPDVGPRQGRSLFPTAPWQPPFGEPRSEA